jgi:tetratricopeptide (TPR) repeat protein
VVGTSASAELVESVVERAAGNAFYLEELIRAVVGGKAESFPETVVAMVQARLEGLEPEARRVLRAASVFGQVFWRGGVAALLRGTNADMLHEWLRIHERSELISSRPLARFPGEVEYVFRHALVREAAYAMLTDGDRVLGHRLAARWLEAAGEGDAMVMAEHLERGGSAAAAVSWYRAAAVQALEGNDFDAAVNRAERAIACGAVGEERGALRLVEAEANRWRGEHVAARTTALQAMVDLPRGAPAWYSAIGEAVLATGRMGLYDDLTSLVDELGAATDTMTPCAPQLAATARAGFYLLFAGKTEVAARLLSWIERVQGALVDADPATRGRVHQARALGALAVADAGAYLTQMQASADSFLEAGDLRSACSQRTNTGYAYVAIGAPQRGAHELRPALAEADAMGLYTVAAMLRTNLGLALMHLGELEEGRQVLERAVEVLSAQRDARLLGAAKSYLAALLLRAGDAHGAERQARDAVEVLASTPPARAYALAVLARVLLERACVAEALVEAERAMAILTELGGIEEGEVQVRLVHADALRRAGRIEEARTAISRAADEVRARAAKITDALWQRSFLENVPENARTLELAASW